MPSVTIQGSQHDLRWALTSNERRSIIPDRFWSLQDTSPSMTSTPNETPRDDSPRLVAMVGHDTFRTPLPTLLTTLVGRAAEVQALARQLSDPTVHLVTLTGTGGGGKTRLALAAAAILEAPYGG